MPDRADGGLIHGSSVPGDDSVLVQLSPGYVIPAHKVAELGLDLNGSLLLQALNEGRISGAVFDAEA